MYIIRCRWLGCNAHSPRDAETFYRSLVQPDISFLGTDCLSPAECVEFSCDSLSVAAYLSCSRIAAHYFNFFKTAMNRLVKSNRALL